MINPPVPDPSSEGESTDVAPRRRGPGPVSFALLSVLVVVAGVVAGVALNYRSQHAQANLALRLSGLPSDVPTSTANLMALSPVPTTTAAAFTLTDQFGHTLSLRDFRGHAVVLEFMDTHCTDICPLVSEEFVDAYHDLGSQASHVTFIAINVNKFHAQVTDVAAFSRAHRLDTIPSWHFFTGSLHDLQATWRKYGVDVIAPSPTADVIHSSYVYFIDPQGRERYIGDPTDDHTAAGTAYLPANQITAWGKGIADVARSLVG